MASDSSIQQRLEAKLIVTQAGCKEYSGARNVAGYGRIRVAGKTLLAHRLAWELAGNALPPGGQVLHRCDNPACCNVEHLFLGDDAANRLDMAIKGRGRKGALPYGVGRNGRKFFAHVKLGGKDLYLGTFENAETANAVALETKARLLKEARDGSAT